MSFSASSSYRSNSTNSTSSVNSTSSANSTNDITEHCGRFILRELLSTERQYVDDLSDGLERYSRIFDVDAELPSGLVGRKQAVLLNVKEMLVLHRHKLLPLMLENSHQLEQLFQSWCTLIDRNCFECYVLYAACQRTSLELCKSHELFFKSLQIKLGDALGLHSFLLKPVQRVTKYPLILNRFIEEFYGHRQLISKHVFQVACQLEKRLRYLVERANQADQLNDISYFHVFNALSAANFIAVGEFVLIDDVLRRSYKSKLFIFNSYFIYTEIKAKSQLFRGKFKLPDVCFVAKPKSFLLCNKNRQCEFLCQSNRITKWKTIVNQLLRESHEKANANGVEEMGTAERMEMEATNEVETGVQVEDDNQVADEEEKPCCSNTIWYDCNI